MIDEAMGEDEAALLVDQREAAATQAIIIAIIAHAELLFAAEMGIYEREIGVVRGLHAIFDTLAIGMEAGEKLPVILFQRRKIAVGDRPQPLARHTLVDRDCAVEGGLGFEARVGENQRFVDLADDQHFHFRNRVLPVHADAQCHR